MYKYRDVMSHRSATDRACVPRRNQAQHPSNEIRMKGIQQIQADHRVAADVGNRTLQGTRSLSVSFGGRSLRSLAAISSMNFFLKLSAGCTRG